jgi:hypothetical protein
MVVYVEKEGAELAWFQAAAPLTGSITLTAEGLGASAAGR